MMINKLYISDLHLDESPKNEYMWAIFPWMHEQIVEHEIKEIVILGDITEKKDRHPSTLVNRLIKCLRALVDSGCKITILKGNHDYVDSDNPFFNFLNNHNGIEYIKYPEINIGDNPFDRGVLYLPHSSDPDKDWEHIKFEECKTIFMHQGVEGCVYANQHESLHGIPKTFFEDRGFTGKVYSGDIHVPQDVTDHIEYVGAPYSIRFGDHYRGRAILDDGMKKISLYPDFLIKWSLEIADIHDFGNFDIFSGDRIKVRVTLDRVDIFKYKDFCKEIKDFCEANEAELCGIVAKVVGNTPTKKLPKGQKKDETDVDILQRFGVAEKISDEQASVGMKIIEDLKKKA